MKRKAISCLLVLASVLTMTPSIPTLAAENQAGKTVVNETLADENQADKTLADKTLADETQTDGTSIDGQQETNASGSKAAVVKYDQASSFTVTIPKSIVLNSNKTANYNVKVKGDVLGNEIITVIPDQTVTLNDANGKDPVTGNITQEKTEFSSTEVNQIDGTKTNGNIAADNLTSGDWSGNFTFSINTNQIGDGISLTNSNLDTYQIDTVGDVVIPDYVTDDDNTRHAVTSIGDYAFRDCNEMTSIAIADSVTEIGTGAFANCSKLSNVSLPSALKTVKSNVFEGCPNLSAIQYKENSYDKTDIGSALTENDVTIDSELFEHTYGEPTYVWSEDGQTCTAKRTCVNHPLAVETEEAAISSTVKEAATCTTKGTTTYTATFKDTVFVTQTKDIQDIAIVNHNYVNNVCTVCNAKEPGLYNANGAMLCTWEESGINVASDYTADTYKTDTGSPYYVITNSYPATTNVVIPEGIKRIGSYSFDECKALNSVKIPNSVTNIRYRSFYNCSGLTSVNIPDGITNIESNTFNGCSSLTNITIPESVTNIDFNAFCNCSSLTNITIPQNVTHIDSGVFKDCTSLTNVVFEENSALQTLGNEYPTSDKYYYGVFQGCTSLRSIEIPDSITSTGDATFRDCTVLETVHLPNSLKEVRKQTFNGCSLLTNITIPDSATSIGNEAFMSCSGLTSIAIPDNVKTVDYDAFKDCTSLKSVNIGSGMESMSSGIFRNDSALEAVSFNNNNKLLTLGVAGGNKSGVFQGCTSLQSITIPDSVTNMGSYAFCECENLVSVNMPDNLNAIENNTFNGCFKLTNVTIPESVTYIGYDAFRKCTSLTSITIPASVTSIDTNTFGYCSSLASVVFEENSALQTLGREHTDPDRSYYGAFQDCASLKSIEIPDSVTSIGDSTFENCKALESVHLPKSLKKVGKYAFNNCSKLTNIVIPDNVTSIGKNAFSRSGLTSITIPDSVTSIGDWAFFGCPGLASVTYKGQTYISKSALTTALTDNNVTLGKDIFYGAALTN